jgi:hypothetical protein
MVTQTKDIELMQPVFDFLDRIIRDDGDYLFMGLVFLLIPFGIWTLSGGLRRKLFKGKPMPPAPPPTIVVQIPVGRPTPPNETFDPFPPLCETLDSPLNEHDETL